ncbi:hypothetical protein [Clostridium tyrobutyricum]|uniref:hypothetical protein n=1 Tax=Clostridium tyrobutyricum TaxID=1519 RepID=UPI001C393A85|nr:hypothetical protein [Clostridium tyrobutyricum]MBV4414672.1 hypothetical protein [Clostridium tyrobutyricum]
MIMENLLSELHKNIFIPDTDVPEKQPDSPGAYLICVKNLDALPEKMKCLDYNFIDGLPVIYVGTARSSTLRKSKYFNIMKKNIILKIIKINLF